MPSDPGLFEQTGRTEAVYEFRDSFTVGDSCRYKINLESRLACFFPEFPSCT
jgi:hypothetical protein